MANPVIYPATVNTGNYIVGALTSVNVVAKAIPDDVGNAIVACLLIIGGIDPGVIVPPSGWTQVEQVLVDAVSRAAVFTKIVAPGETGTYPFAWTNPSAVGFWLFAEYGGGDQDYATDGSGNNNNALSVNCVAPSVTPSSWNYYNTLVCVWFALASIGVLMSITPPVGMTLQAQSASLSLGFPALALADAPLVSNGPTGTSTAIAAAATISVGISFLIRQSIWAGVMPQGGTAT
jgi:hypothetical protein